MLLNHWRRGDKLRPCDGCIFAAAGVVDSLRAGGCLYYLPTEMCDGCACDECSLAVLSVGQALISDFAQGFALIDLSRGSCGIPKSQGVDWKDSQESPRTSSRLLELVPWTRSMMEYVFFFFFFGFQVVVLAWCWDFKGKNCNKLSKGICFFVSWHGIFVSYDFAILAMLQYLTSWLSGFHCGNFWCVCLLLPLAASLDTICGSTTGNSIQRSPYWRQVFDAPCV